MKPPFSFYKYSFVLIFTLFCYCFSFSQIEFAPVGAKWWYVLPCADLNPDCGYSTFESVNDTILLNKNAKIIKYTVNGVVKPEATQIMYSDSDKIYYYMNNKFYMLYDFGAKAGDTLKIKLGPQYFTNDTIGYYHQMQFYHSMILSI